MSSVPPGDDDDGDDTVAAQQRRFGLLLSGPPWNVPPEDREAAMAVVRALIGTAKGPLAFTAETDPDGSRCLAMLAGVTCGAQEVLPLVPGLVALDLRQQAKAGKRPELRLNAVAADAVALARVPVRRTLGDARDGRRRRRAARDRTEEARATKMDATAERWKEADLRLDAVNAAAKSKGLRIGARKAAQVARALLDLGEKEWPSEYQLENHEKRRRRKAR